MLAFCKQIIFLQEVIENRLIYFNSTVGTLLKLVHYFNRVYVVMHCNEISFQELLDCFVNDLENKHENISWNLEHMQKIVGNS